MSNYWRVLTFSSLVALATACAIVPSAFATRGSILPSSFAKVAAFGADPYPADLEFVGDNPCAVIAGTNSAKVRVTHLACGRRLQQRKVIDLTPHPERPAAMDVRGSTIDIVGWTEPSGGGIRPYLVRVDASGVPNAAFGVGGVAQLEGLAPSGHRSVMLGSVESLGDGSVIVAGNAVTGKTGDRVAFVAKVSPTGVLDPTFGDGGVREIRVAGFARSSPTDIRVLDDGTLLVIGWSSVSLTATFHSFAALLDGTGDFVPTFGTDGISRPLPDAATALVALPEATNGGSWPVAVSGGTNSKGKAKPFVIQLQQDGRRVPDWGGPSSHTTVTMYGGPLLLHNMYVERLPDGTIVGAAERYTNGETDSFVTRFKPLSGSPDRGWSVAGFEPIDTVPGRADWEYTAAIALSPDGQPWVIGGNTVGTTDYIHLFRVRNKGALIARWAASDVVALGSNGRARSCGRSARRPCAVRRGTAVRLGARVAGWDPTRASLLRPTLRVWSKPPRKGWVMRERLGTSTHRSGGYTVILRQLRLPVGIHALYVHRNGGNGIGPTWSTPLHVRVR